MLATNPKVKPLRCIALLLKLPQNQHFSQKNSQ